MEGTEASDGEEEGPCCGARSWTVLLPKRDKTKVGLGQSLTAETTPCGADWSLKSSYHGFSGNTNHSIYLQYTSSRKLNAKISGLLQDSI